jgi:hypothetical protein
LADSFLIKWKGLRRETRRESAGVAMKYIVEVLALLILGAIAATAVLIFGRPSVKVAQGELRCEGAGAVIIRIAGEDYAVNTLAGWQFPPVQIVWNKDTFPETNIDRLIVKGLTLCDWHTAAKKK